MPGCSSAVKTSAPANVAVNRLMMLRGMVLPSASLRWPVSMTCEMRVLTSMTSPTLALSGSLMRALAMMLPAPACGVLELPTTFAAGVHRQFRDTTLAAATADRHLDVALARQEPSVAQLGDADDVLGAG